MIIGKAPDMRYSEVTPKKDFLNRRSFLTTGLAAGAALAAGGGLLSMGSFSEAQAALAGEKLAGVRNNKYVTDEKLTPFDDIKQYNNFYEFGTAKDDPAVHAKNFQTRPWTIEVGGEIANPKTYDTDEIMKLAPLEERIYRLRCVEAWSMVVPWIGFPLNAVIRKAEPNSKAKYVAFETYYDPKQMPLGRSAGIQLPYVEGLRLDEAMHPLALLSFGIYGEVLPNQNGAPLRLVVPWKYGFKSIKSIIKISFVEKEPPTTWNISAPREYGFYSNVNPKVNHPRWSQAKERRIGNFFRRDTLMFNGYPEVASMYSGMDMKKNY